MDKEKRVKALKRAKKSSKIKRGYNKDSPKTVSLDEIFVKNKETIKKIQHLILPIKEKYALSFDDLLSLIKKEEIAIPLSIFNKELGSLESISKYLKENLKLTYH